MLTHHCKVSWHGVSTVHKEYDNIQLMSRHFGSSWAPATSHGVCEVYLNLHMVVSYVILIAIKLLFSLKLLLQNS